ncbi:MAG TPA: polyphosphate kinase 2 family protein [Terriglobales bacterium]|nr:polyphosphate kinase 2 family protein [Terriglobales bacterium]
MKLRREVAEFVNPYRITDGKRFSLKDYDPADTHDLKSSDKQKARDLLVHGVSMLADLQDKLYAQDRWALLLIFQAMDAAGKDSTIKHVMSGVNPQGCQVYSFKAPSPEELDHDYLWRTTKCVPERGRIGIFNRSYYEEVLVVRVHPAILHAQKLPSSLVTKEIWRQRFEDINAFERYMTRNGIVIRKFFLHLSKKEQRKRFLNRLDEPEKNWKFSLSDVKEREFWDQYQDAYEEMIRATSTEHAPWFVVPADNKWYTRLVVAEATVEALHSMDLDYPKVDAARRKEIDAAKKELGENRKGRK